MEKVKSASDKSFSEKSVEEIIKESMGLVGHIIKKHFPQFLGSTHYEDVLQEGVVGVLRAIESFDESLGNQFSTYAYYTIRSSIFRNTKGLLSPAAVSRDSHKIYKTYITLLEEGLSWEEIRERLGVKDSTLRDTINAFEYTSLDKAVNSSDSGNETYLSDFITIEEEDSHIHELNLCNTLINLMPPRMAEIFRLRLHGVSQKEIGSIVGVTQVNVGRNLIKTEERYLPYFRQYVEGEIGYGELLVNVFRPQSDIKRYLKCYINFAIELSNEGHRVKGPLLDVFRRCNLKDVNNFLDTPTRPKEKVPSEIMSIVKVIDKWCASEYIEKVIESRVNNEDNDWLAELI